VFLDQKVIAAVIYFINKTLIAHLREEVANDSHYAGHEQKPRGSFIDPVQRHQSENKSAETNEDKGQGFNRNCTALRVFSWHRPLHDLTMFKGRGIRLEFRAIRLT
jgi:hypothetical protein